MKIQILYQTQYAYDEPVGFSPHLFRLFPKAGRHVRVLRSQFQTNLDAQVNFRRDLFDNEVASCFYPEKSTLLQASFDLALEIEEQNAFGFILARHALDLPLMYTEREARVLAPFLAPPEPLGIAFWQPPAKPMPTVEALVGLNEAIHGSLAYERREEGDPFPPAELLARGAGSCRDFAALLVVVLHNLGLAARLASGYLCEFGDARKVAEGALHAWVEVYLPGAGWVGMDPTNGTFCDHHHLSAAVGLDPADIAPIVGNFATNKKVASHMSASLRILPT